MALDSVTNSAYHDIKVSLKCFSLDGVMTLISVSLALFLMALDSPTNNIYHDIKMSLKVFSHDGAVTLASIYRGTRIYRGIDRSGNCSKYHKTKKCH